MSERISALEARLAKDSHNSHPPPSSDRFERQPKSLRKQSGKQPGGQAGHAGNTLKLSETPDLVIVHPVDCCQHALCNVHHLRDLTFLYEEQQQDWAGRMKTLLLDIKAAVEQARAESRTSLHPLEVADWKAHYGALLEEGYRANPPDSPPEAGK